MNLYRKYRPKHWEEVFGNTETISSISSMIEEPDKNSHVFLLTGHTGCGKTTIARLMAKELGVSKTDIQEINSSDFRGIDSAREIIKAAQYKPLESNYRFFILDEVHQWTKDAENAMLKTLEDVPNHVYFVLCTTDPQKMLPTTRNRCSMYEVQPLTRQQTKGLIKSVCKAEGESLDKEVLSQIANTSEGHPRQALTILEQVLNVEPELRLEAAKKTQVLENESIELCRALIGNSDWNKVKTILNGLRSQNPESIRRHVLGYAQAILLKSDNEKAGLILEEFLPHTYDSGFPQIVFASYSVIKNS